MEKLVALCKRRGFIFQSSEIYGGLQGFWDYGPLGVELKNNIKKQWWHSMVKYRDDVVGLDAAIMMNTKVWEASGHVDAFTDPLVECKICHSRFRADKEEEIKAHEKTHKEKVEWTEPKSFNLLVEAYLGVAEPKQKVYLRGEITQGAFVNFENVVNSTRVKIPFGIAQIGKAFRNEITPGNFTYRSREFEKAAEDIEYNAPFGWSEFEGVHNRGDWDLSRHKLTYKEEGKEFTPWVIETSGGVDRSTLFFLLDSYHEENGRVILKLHPKLAPYKAAVFPLLANKPELVEKAKGIYDSLKKDMMVAWDDRGNIGKRYFAQDEIGTPFCITVDFQTLEDNTVTVRNRDTAKQERLKIQELPDFLSKKLS